MRKNGIIILIYSIVAALYVALTLILSTDRNSVFWIGFAMALFSVTLMAATTIISNKKKTSAFPIEISMVIFSAIYLIIVIAVNVIFGFVLKATVNIFISIHILCLALYSIITLLLFIAKAGIIEQNNQVNSKICKMQILIYEFEKIKSKLIDMPTETKKKALPLIDSLIDELRFSDFGLNVDVSDIDTKLHAMAEMLSAEVDNLSIIKSDDLTSIESIVNDIKKVVKDRNMRIKLTSSSI